MTPTMTPTDRQLELEAWREVLRNRLATGIGAVAETLDQLTSVRIELETLCCESATLTLGDNKNAPIDL
jgi:hypothetical protein